MHGLFFDTGLEMTNDKKGKKTGKGKRQKKSILLIFVALVMIGAALWNILPDYLDRLRSAQTYEKLQDAYVDVSPEPDQKKKKDWWLTDVKVAFDELKEENPEIVAWIRSDDPESTRIDYPVLYSGDNEKYLRSDLYGESHIAGSIFLEGLNEPDFSDYYTIIYGHNMNDGSMFGTLKKYQDKAFWEENQYFTLYTEGMAYRYRIFACQEAVNGGDVYKIGYEPGEEYQAFLDGLAADSLVDTGIRPDSSHKTMTLSTCTASGYSRRFAVHAYCVDAQATDIAGE